MPGFRKVFIEKSVAQAIKGYGQHSNDFAGTVNSALERLQVGLKIGFLVGEAELFSNIHAVGFDGLVGEVQGFGNVLGTPTMFDEIGHFDFRGG